MDVYRRSAGPKGKAPPDSDLAATQLNEEPTALPKHIPFPAQIDDQPNWAVEAFIFLVSLFALGLVYLEMYQTVWWVPEYFNKQALHFDLIDKILLAFIVVILARKVMAQFVLSSAKYLRKRGRAYHTLATYLPHIYAFQLFCLLGVCCFEVFVRYGFWDLLCLIYPLVLYVIIFRVKLEPFWTTFEPQAKYFNGIPVHCCSTKACTIRAEVDGLRIDLHNRFKQTIFSSIVLGYYAGFIPYWFVHQHLVHNPWTAILNSVFIWIGGFTLTTVQCFPPKYSDVLHRAALHLGQWEPEPVTVSSHIPVWSANHKCLADTLVKHEGVVYRATAPITTAIPGNSVHYRFYAIFKNPTAIYSTLTVVQVLLLATQLLRLYYSTSWNAVLTLSYLIFTNFVTFYCLLRNLKVVHSIYSVEMASKKSD